MRVVVTGAAGFIGSQVADRLLDLGHEVWAVDNFDPYYDPAQKWRNVARAKQSQGYHLREVDVRNREALAAVFDEAAPSAVVHLAARAGVRASVESPLSYIEVNELGGFYVLDECLRRGKLPLVLASTSSVYGASTNTPFRETEPACEPLSPYAASKRASELMAYAYWHIHRQPTVMLRFFTVYGPRGRPDMAYAKFTEAMLRNEPIRLHGPDTERDFTYIDDIVDGVVGAMGWLSRERVTATFNLGGRSPINIRRMVTLLADRLGRVPRIEMGSLQPGESLKTAADTSAAERAFGFVPKVSIAEGTGRWVDWLRSEESSPEIRQLLHGA